MKKAISLALAALLCALCAGCTQPDSQTLDLYQGYGNFLKLIHLNASSAEKQERMDAFAQVLEDSQPLDKEFSLFAYYPDYCLELKKAGEAACVAIVDVNGDYIDFYYVGEDGTADPQLYRSHVTADQFRKLVHQS